ncbi:MAG: hypothetical protein ACXW25_08285, partial [Rhodospirillales bacterium]
MTAADTDAGAEGATSRQAGEAIVTRSSAEAMAVPEAAVAEPHTRTRSDGATERSDHHPQPANGGANSTVATEDIARRVVAEERARIAGIYDAARKLAIDQSVGDDLVRRGITLDEARTVLIDQAAERDRAVETRPHI